MMKVRLVKPDLSPPKATDEPPIEPPSQEVQITDTIRSWVSEFKSSKAHQAGLDSQQVNLPKKPRRRPSKME